ncbi:MAG: histidine kinase [Pseudonocardia sp.]|nr:histidine kinase [Pseudonocardia sp.]
MTRQVAGTGQVAGRRTPTAWVRWVAIGIWLFYLTEPAEALLRHPLGWQQTVGLAALLGFAAVYLFGLAGGLWRGRPVPATEEWPAPGAGWTPGARWVHLAGLVALAALVVPGAGPAALNTVVFVAAAAVATLPRAAGIAVWVLLAVGTEAVERLVPGWGAGQVGVAVVLAGVAVLAFRLAGDRREALMQAERDLHELAMTEQRNRIARDLHDILGHSLTVLAVKAELAQGLLDADPARARAELADIADLTRDALADVRATARGARGVSLAAEVAAARSALDAAGIRAALPTATEHVPARLRELFAWAVREGVTNVIRHSGATTCTVRLDPARLEIRDDGPTAFGSGCDGQGLAGLRERARMVDAVLDAGALPGGGHRLLVDAGRAQP